MPRPRTWPGRCTSDRDGTGARQIGSSFNVAVAIGMLYDLKHRTMLYGANGEPLDSAFGLDGYVRIGFAF